MRLPPRFLPSIVAAAAAVLLGPAGSRADFRTCEQAISSGTVKFARTQYTVLRKCNDAVVKGVRPGPCPDLRTMVKVANAAAKLRAAIDAACGGANRQCGGGDDIPLPSVGWNLSACPNIEGGACTNAIADCGDVADCVTCVATAAVNQAVGVTYGDLDLAQHATDVVACQRAIGKFTEKFFGKQVRALQKCGSRVLLGYAAGPCPDPIAVAAIQKAEAKKVRVICKFCGGPDRSCGGGDDLTPATIGFGSSCPAVTVPRGTSCAAPITDMQSIVACADCIAEFKGDCVAAIGVPDVLGYPAECQGGAPATATPTPAATSTSGATATPPGGTPTPPPTATRTATPSIAPTPTVPLPTSTLLPTVTLPVPTATLPLPTVTLPLPTSTVVPTVTLPLPTVTLPLPTLTLPLPTLTLPLPTLTLPLPTLTLPLPTLTLPLPTLTPTPVPTPVCGNGVIEAGEQCELLAGGCTGLQVCVLCQCVL